MPAEWAPHQGTIFTWPQRSGCSFPPPYDRGVAETYMRLIEELSHVEEVHINCWDSTEISWIRSLVSQSKADPSQVFLHHHPSYEPWCRDHGPIILKHPLTRERIATDWLYNAWGDKYPPYDLDNTIPRKMADFLQIGRVAIPMVLEGGSIEVNGQGDLLTTESCLLNPNRNPDMTQAEIENHLMDFLGMNRILWLESGIEGDDTDGHIDDLTRFIAPDRLVTVMEKNTSDPNASILANNRDRLAAMTTSSGGRFEIIDLPMPSPVIRDGNRLPASYANFYIANGIVLLPVFNQPEDEAATGILGECFPDRKIIPINSLPLIWGLGSFHCITQQIPG